MPVLDDIEEIQAQKRRKQEEQMAALRGPPTTDGMQRPGNPITNQADLPVSRPAPYPNGVTNNDVLAVANRPAAVSTAPVPANPIAEAYKGANLDREEINNRIWLARYGAPENRNPGAVPGLIQQRHALEREIGTMRPGAVAPIQPMPFQQARASRDNIRDQIIGMVGIEESRQAEEAARAKAAGGPPQPQWRPTDQAGYDRAAQMKQLGVNDLDMRELETLAGRTSPALPTAPSRAPVNLPPQLTREAFDEEQLAMAESRAMAQSQYDTANQTNSPASQAAARYSPFMLGEQEMIRAKREAALNEVKARSQAAAMQADPELAKAKLNAETEAIRAGAAQAQGTRELADLNLERQRAETGELRNRMATVDEQADGILRETLPGLKQLITSHEVDQDMGPLVTTLAHATSQLLARTRGWSPEKAETYRSYIKGQLGISKPTQLDLNNFRDKVNRWLSVLPTSGAAREDAVANREQADMVLSQLKAFLFPGS